MRQQLPEMAILNLRLLGMDGSEVLEVIRGDADLWRVPVLMLTGQQEADVDRAFKARAHAFTSKPVDLDGYGKIAELVTALAHSHVWAK